MKQFFKKTWFEMIVIILIAFITIYWCCAKKGMFLDEIYSYGLSNSQNAPFINTIAGNIVDTTITKEVLFDYVAVGEVDAFDYASVYQNQVRDVHPPLFYMILHTISSIFQHNFSKWIGLGLNLVLFACTLVVYWLLMKKLMIDREIAWCGVILYAFHTLAISTILMIRMYMLLTLLTVLLAYQILCLDKTRKWYQYFGIAATIAAGFLTQYYYVFYAFFLCAIYCLVLIRKKQYKQFVSFAFFAWAGIILAYLFFPACLRQLFYDNEVSANSAIGNIKSFENYGKRFATFLSFVLNGGKVACFLGLASLILCISNYKNLYREYKEKTISLQPILYILPAALSFVIIAIIAPYVANRYIYNLIPFFVMSVCFVMTLAKRSFCERECEKQPFMLMVLLASVIFAFYTEPSYVYRHYENQDKKISQYANEPCIYFTENRNPAITSDLEQLLYFDRIYVTLSADSEQLDAYMDSFEEYSNTVVHIATYPKKMEEEKLLNKLCENYQFGSYEKLYGRGYSNVYVLKR